MSHSSRCLQISPESSVTYLVVPVYGLIAGLPGMLRVAANLHFSVSMLGPETFKLTISAFDFVASNNLDTAAVYGCTPLTFAVGSLNWQSGLYALGVNFPVT
ncbi:hypothetical protein ABBQ32_013377 [Trebouxia sp. C0010 RCD-2024]